MAKFTIRVDPITGQNYLPRDVRREGFVGEVEGLANALTVTFIKPGARLADVQKSLRIIEQDLELRIQQGEGHLQGGRQEPGHRPQDPLFTKYNREYLSEVTGYSGGYLSRVANGKIPVSRSFIERVCFALGEPAGDLFSPEVGRTSPSLKAEKRRSIKRETRRRRAGDVDEGGGGESHPQE